MNLELLQKECKDKKISEYLKFTPQTMLDHFYGVTRTKRTRTRTLFSRNRKNNTGSVISEADSFLDSTINSQSRMTQGDTIMGDLSDLNFGDESRMTDLSSIPDSGLDDSLDVAAGNLLTQLNDPGLQGAMMKKTPSMKKKGPQEVGGVSGELSGFVEGAGGEFGGEVLGDLSQQDFSKGKDKEVVEAPEKVIEGAKDGQGVIEANQGANLTQEAPQNADEPEIEKIEKTEILAEKSPEKKPSEPEEQDSEPEEDPEPEEAQESSEESIDFDKSLSVEEEDPEDADPTPEPEDAPHNFVQAHVEDLDPEDQSDLEEDPNRSKSQKNDSGAQNEPSEAQNTSNSPRASPEPKYIAPLNFHARISPEEAKSQLRNGGYLNGDLTPDDILGIDILRNILTDLVKQHGNGPGDADKRARKASEWDEHLRKAENGVERSEMEIEDWWDFEKMLKKFKPNSATAKALREKRGKSEVSPAVYIPSKVEIEKMRRKALFPKLDLEVPTTQLLYNNQVKLDPLEVERLVHERYYSKKGETLLNLENNLKTAEIDNDELDETGEVQEGARKETPFTDFLKKVDSRHNYEILTNADSGLQGLSKQDLAARNPFLTSKTSKKLSRAEIQAEKEKKHNLKREQFRAFTPLLDSITTPFQLSPVSADPCKPILTAIKGSFKGKLNCFHMNQKLALFGTTKGEIVELDLSSNKVRTYKIKGAVLSVDINHNSTIWAAGSDQGQLTVRKALGGWTKKTYPDFAGGRPVTQIRFYKTMNLVVSTDIRVFRLIMRDIKLTFDITRTDLCGKVKNICQVLTMPIDMYDTLNITASLDSLRFTIMNAEGVKQGSKIKRPAGIEKGWVPTISWMTPLNESKKSVIVYWKDRVLMVRNHGLDFVICGTKLLLGNVIWGAVLGNRIVCMVFEDYNMRLETFENLFSAEDSKKEVFGGNFELPKELRSMSRVISGKEGDAAGKAGKGAKGGKKVVRTHQEKIRSLDNGIGFVCGSTFTRVGLLGLDALAKRYTKLKEYEKALGLVVNFSVKSGAEKNQDVLNLMRAAPSLIKEYLNHVKKGGKGFGGGKNENVEIRQKTQISTALVYAMEVCVKTKNREHIFKALIKQFEAGMFWKGVNLLVENRLIEHISWDKLRLGIDFLSDESLKYLLMNLVPSDLTDDASFEKLSKILETKNLWLPYYKYAFLFPKRLLMVLVSRLWEDMAKEEVQDAQNSQILADLEKSDKKPKKSDSGFSETTETIDGTIASTTAAQTHDSDEEQLEKMKIVINPNKASRKLLVDKFSVVSIEREYTVTEDYLALFWLLWKSITWSETQGLSDPKNQQIALDSLFSWLFAYKNLKKMNKAQIQLTTELVVPYLKKTEFLENEEKKLFIKEKWKRISKLYGIDQETVKSDQLCPGEDKHPWVGANHDQKTSRMILVILFEAMEKKYKRQFAWLFVKLADREGLDYLLDEIVWGLFTLDRLVGAKFKQNEYWRDWDPISKSEFEETLISFVKKLDERIEGVRELARSRRKEGIKNLILRRGGVADVDKVQKAWYNHILKRAKTNH